MVQNSQKQSRDSQNSKNDHWCTNRHMSTKTVSTVYQSSMTVKNSQKTVKTAKMTIGVPIVTGLPRLYKKCTNGVPIAKRQSKQQKWPLMYQSSHVYQDYQPCTNCQNSQKTVKDSQNSKNDHWCTNRHMSTKTVSTMYQQCTKNSQKTVKTAKITVGVPIVTCLFRVRRIYKVSIRRIHKALISLGTDYAWCPLWAIIADFLEKSRETSLPDSGLRPPHHRAHYVRFRTVFFTAQRAYKYYKLRGTITLTIRALKLSADASPTIVADDHSVN